MLDTYQFTSVIFPLSLRISCHCEVRPWRLGDAWATGDVGAGWEVLLARPMRVGTVLIGEVAVENCFLKKGLDGSAASIP